jgi:hypothetical protein
MSRHAGLSTTDTTDEQTPQFGTALPILPIGPLAFAGLDHAAIAAATAPASSVLPPLDLTQLGDFHNSNESQGSLVVAGPELVGGNVAFVDAKTLATGGYVVSAGTDQGFTSAGGGATIAIDSGPYSSPIGDTQKLVFDFHQDSLNPGHYQLSLNFISMSTPSNGVTNTLERTFKSFGDVSVLGWNANSILLTTTATPHAAGPLGDIVISTTDMSKQGGIPTNTTFTTTGPAPVILGTTVPEVPCFAAGTMIATPDGLRAVEDLAAGDMVWTHGGIAKQISWIGSRTVDCTAHPDPRRVHPVRIARHAFGTNLPQRDLVLSPDHSVFLGGVLIPICELINGQNVVQERANSAKAPAPFRCTPISPPPLLRGKPRAPRWPFAAPKSKPLGTCWRRDQPWPPKNPWKQKFFGFRRAGAAFFQKRTRFLPAWCDHVSIRRASRLPVSPRACGSSLPRLRRGGRDTTTEWRNLPSLRPGLA